MKLFIQLTFKTKNGIKKYNRHTKGRIIYLIKKIDFKKVTECTIRVVYGTKKATDVLGEKIVVENEATLTNKKDLISIYNDFTNKNELNFIQKYWNL